MPRNLFAESRTLGDVHERLSNILSHAGYGEQSVYAVPAQSGVGFAIITRLEQFYEDGTPYPAGERNLPPNLQKGRFDLTAFIKRIFVTPFGYYRFAIFIVTNQPFVTHGPRISADEAQLMLDYGADRLPTSFEDSPFWNHRVSVLIYEYRWDSNRAEARPNVPSLLPPQVHLSGSGLADALGFY